MSGYTKGPWKLSRTNPSPTTGEWMISGSKPGYLAEVRDCGSGDVKANAHLIAAAPDLLEALESLADTDINGADDSVIRFILAALQHKARAAIARARGEA